MYASYNMSDTSAAVVIDTDRGVRLGDLARMFNVPAVTLRRWAASGDLPAWRHGEHGPWRALPEDVVALIRHNHDAQRRRDIRRR